MDNVALQEKQDITAMQDNHGISEVYRTSLFSWNFLIFMELPYFLLLAKHMIIEPGKEKP